MCGRLNSWLLVLAGLAAEHGCCQPAWPGELRAEGLYDAEARFALLYQRSGMSAQAIALAEEVLKRHPENTEAALDLVFVLLGHGGPPDRLIALLRKAFTKEPDRPLTGRLLTLSLMLAHRAEEAAQVFVKWKGFVPDCKSVRHLEGFLRATAREWPAASESAGERAIGTLSLLETARRHLYVAEFLVSATTARPDNGSVEWEPAQTAEAFREALAVVSACPTWALGWRVLAACFNIIGAEREELACLQSALALDPDGRITALFRVAELCLRMERYEEALDAARKLAQFTPDVGWLYDIMRKALVELGEFEQARDAIDKAIEYLPLSQLPDAEPTVASLRQTGRPFVAEVIAALTEAQDTESPHFRLRLRADAPGHRAIVEKALEESWETASRELGFAPTGKPVCIDYLPKDARTTPAPGRAPGLYLHTDNVIYFDPATVLKDTEKAQHLLGRAYLELAVRRLCASRWIPWIERGVGLYLALGSERALAECKQVVAKDRTAAERALVPLEQLATRTIESSGASWQVVEAETVSAIDVLVQRGGMGGIRQLLGQIGGSASVEEALHTAFEIRYDELDKEVRESLLE